MHTSNPTLNERVFEEARREVSAESGLMSIQGTMAKTSILLVAALVSASFTWQKAMAGGNAMPWVIGGAIAGLVVALIISFKPTSAPLLAVPYALLKGLMLGGISATYALAFDGPQGGGIPGAPNSIVLQAVLLTITVALSMFLLYAFRIIKVTDRLRSMVLIATGGVLLMYVVSFALSFFMSSNPIGALHQGGMIGIGFSLFVVGLAAFNLLIDFDMIEQGSRAGAPKYMEWYGAFALVVTLIWLYIELLRLLAKLRSND